MPRLCKWVIQWSKLTLNEGHKQHTQGRPYTKWKNTVINWHLNLLRTVVTCMHQGNKYITVHKQIIITSPPFTCKPAVLFYSIWPSVTTNPKLKNPAQRLKYVSIIIIILLTFCKSLPNFFPDHPTKGIQRTNKSWCYGDSHDI